MAKIAVRLFGSVEMFDADGRELHSLPSQPKRFGLLAYLAIAQPRGFHSRDKLMGLFWPEANREQARHALNQALHVLRSELGEGAFRSRGDSDVAIDQAAISCDVVEFELALEEDQYEQALELYRGDLMEGLFVREAPEFERWLEDERTRLREKAAGAAWALAHEHIRADRLVDAERTAQRALLLVPTDESEVRRFIQALADAGDRAAAVRFYEKFANRLRSEYEIEPDPLTVAVSRSAADRHQTAERLADALTAEQVTATDQTVTARPKRPARLIAAVGGLAVVIAIVVGVLVLKPSSAPTHERTAIAVLPFQDLTADESRAYFASGLHDELLTQLFKLPALKVIGRSSVLGYVGTTKPLTEIADELGVGSIVEASVQVEGNRLRVNVQLIDAATNEQLWADRYDRTLDDAFATQSEIAEQIVTAVGATLTDAEASAIAAAPTDNAEAYRLYLQGEQYRLRPG
jgi:TolB-like protein/DNA-binding SARP family transcriptional activator